MDAYRVCAGLTRNDPPPADPARGGPNARPGRRAWRARKLQLDTAVYRSHSERASGGNENCDHDFELEPSLEQGRTSLWVCTICGRTFRFERWT